jgi:hypothetical protein
MTPATQTTHPTTTIEIITQEDLQEGARTTATIATTGIDSAPKLDRV